MSGSEQPGLAPLSAPVMPPGCPSRCQPAPMSCVERMIEPVHAWSAWLS
jgi:hypothetical protein